MTNFASNLDSGLYVKHLGPLLRQGSWCNSQLPLLSPELQGRMSFIIVVDGLSHRHSWSGAIQGLYRGLYRLHYRHFCLQH